MSGPANIRAIPEVRRFRIAVMKFREEAGSSVESIGMELQRVSQWIGQDRPLYWEQQLRKAFDLVAATRIALQSCLMRGVGDRKPSCIEEKQAHEAAKRRLQHCHDQIERVKRWGVKISHEIDEFRGRMAGLRRVIDADAPELCDLLLKIAEVLESYADLAGPGKDSPASSP